jgi:putative hydrolase of the HAD superfamily
VRPLRSVASLHRPRIHGPYDATTREPIWLFDLDNTLHDSSKAMFTAIDSAMTQAVADALDVDLAAANIFRQRYWQRYGATVIGMERHHGVNAHHFLQSSHSFEVAPLVHAEKGLRGRLARLPGRKILLTNAPLTYAREVLSTLGILHLFENLWAIDHMRLQGRMRPKPSQALMRQVLARLRAPASRVILVEDTLKNLKSARQLGMRTVHIFHPGTPFSSTHKGRSAYVDLRVNTLAKLLNGSRIPGRPDRA